MPALDNPKRERFCQQYVVDLNATQAYIRAGYAATGAEGNAARLIANDMVSARIAELQAVVSQRLDITQDKVLRDIEATRKAATGDKQHATALKASELQGKHIGMWPSGSDGAGVVESLLEWAAAAAKRRLERENGTLIEHGPS